MGSRASAHRLLAGAPQSLAGAVVHVSCLGSWPTTSFVDEDRKSVV